MPLLPTLLQMDTFAALMHGCIIRVLGRHHRLVYLLQTSAHMDNAVIHSASDLAQVRQQYVDVENAATIVFHHQPTPTVHPLAQYHNVADRYTQGSHCPDYQKAEAEHAFISSPQLPRR